MTDRVHLLGIRHHGPGSARSVIAALEALAPSRLLVELPADVTASLSWAGHPDLVPPVALLGYTLGAPVRAAFFPLATFSPEWQAIAWANRHHVPVTAIDLPLSSLLAPDRTDDTDHAPSGPEAEGTRVPGAGQSSPVDPIGELAKAAGEPDAERWWDDMVEHRGGGLDAFTAVAEAMTAVRRSAGDEARVDPETARREAAMRQAIRAVLADAGQADGRVAVVCGAWHVPALELATAPSAAADAITARGRSDGAPGPAHTTKIGVAWVPWTNRRLATRSGYSAGVTSPGWYQHVFAHPGPAGTARFLVEAGHAVRAAGRPASVDHVIAATRLASWLAVIRDRPQAGLAEVLDASDAVYASRDLVLQRLVVGADIGEVPHGAPQVPLARNLAAEQRTCRLRPEPGRKRVELDVRTPNGARRSRLLHRLLAIGVPWGTVVEGRGSSGTFRETWELRWEPEWSVRLVERAGLGVTVAEAATTALRERVAAAARMVEATAVVDAALLADLPDVLPAALRVVSDMAAAAPDIVELIDALGPLAGASRYGDVRQTDRGALRTVFDQVVVRVLAGLERAVVGLDDESAARMAERLTALNGSLGIVDHPARGHELGRVLERVADGRSVPGAVQGRASRLLHDGGRWSPDAVGARLGRALGPGSQPSAAAAFVEGFLAGSGTILLHDRELLDGVDRWLSSLTADAFTTTVPLLRRTFGGFEAAERRRLGVLVASGSSPVTPNVGEDVDAERAALAIATVRRLVGLDRHDG